MKTFAIACLAVLASAYETGFITNEDMTTQYYDQYMNMTPEQQKAVQDKYAKMNLATIPNIKYLSEIDGAEESAWSPYALKNLGEIRSCSTLKSHRCSDCGDFRLLTTGSYANCMVSMGCGDEIDQYWVDQIDNGDYCGAFNTLNLSKIRGADENTYTPMQNLGEIRSCSTLKSHRCSECGDFRLLTTGSYSNCMVSMGCGEEIDQYWVDQIDNGDYCGAFNTMNLSKIRGADENTYTPMQNLGDIRTCSTLKSHRCSECGDFRLLTTGSYSNCMVSMGCGDEIDQYWVDKIDNGDYCQ